jgi:hypothetical protein
MLGFVHNNPLQLYALNPQREVISWRTQESDFQDSKACSQ